MKFWIIRELVGVAILLAAIVVLPVAASRYFAIQEIPFQSQGVPRGAIKLYPSKGETLKALSGTVQAQLAALQDQDYAAAWEMADRLLRQHLPVADFERMIKSGFAMMTEPHSVEYGAIFNNQEVGFVDIKLNSVQSGSYYFSYYLIAADGRWYISGVEPQDPNRFEQGRRRVGRQARSRLDEGFIGKRGI